MILAVRVIPNATRTMLVQARKGEIVLKLHAPARDGRANRAAILFLAEALGVSKAAIRLVAGEKSRHKKFEIVGLDAGSFEKRLADLLSSNPL